jgi:hypothetical protein
MVEAMIGAILALFGAGITIFLTLVVIDIVLLVKLRSMFDRGVPFAGYLTDWLADIPIQPPLPFERPVPGQK